MTIAAVALSFALSITAVPPGQPVIEHTQPYQWGQPVIQQFERHQEDLDRRTAWEAYVRELADLWIEYREAGSTPRAWRQYKAKAGEAKRRYVFGDPYLVPIVDPLFFEP